VDWVKSSLSLANSNCVEVADLPGGEVGVRHSKDPQGPVLRFTADEWQAFLGGVRKGELTLSARYGGYRSDAAAGPCQDQTGSARPLGTSSGECG
jgi:Domain of unknown function (DUF397)